MNKAQKNVLICKFRNSLLQNNVVGGIHNINKSELQEFLEIFLTTSDLKLQNRLIAILSSYILSNGTYSDTIVTWKPMYDKVQEILSTNQPTSTQLVMNFITVLLSANADESHALYARNLIRVSGCLAIMTSLFSGCMMYQDTWVALCHCLAEVCRGCEFNQSYCCHLVPLCLNRYKYHDTEVLALLQSLLQNHERNIQLFLQNNGIAIFTREMLQYEMGMQLLNTIVQSSSPEISILRDSGVVKHLQYFISSCGSHSQIGQWSNIILFRLHSHPQLKGNEVLMLSENKLLDESVNKITRTNKRADDNNETAHLFRNVITEMMNWNSFNDVKSKQPFTMFSCKNNDLKNNVRYTKRDHTEFSTKEKHMESTQRMSIGQSQNYAEKLKCGVKTDLSFSHIVKDFQEPKKYSNRNFCNRGLKSHASAVNKTRHTDFKCGDNKRPCDESDKESVTSFKPAFASTPKSRNTEWMNENSLQVTQSQRSSYATCSIHKSKVQKYYRRRQCRSKKSPVEITTRNNNSNKSFTAKLFSAFNESCSFLAKNVRNIFKVKDKPQPEKEKAGIRTISNTSTCSYSFTNYMRKRDAKDYTSNNNADWDEFSKDNSCKTCDNTVALKYKFANDQRLKDTVKKLKLGINLYGCDFKKISRTVFARETCLTPKVLYNIYRKLIVK